MSVFKVIVDIFQNYVFNQPFIFLSIVAMIGLILQKKSIDKIISGSVKTNRLFNSKCRNKHNRRRSYADSYAAGKNYGD